MLLRRHSGKAWFRDPELRVLKLPPGFYFFDNTPVSLTTPLREGFQVSDVAASVVGGKTLGLPVQTP